MPSHDNTQPQPGPSPTPRPIQLELRPVGAVGYAAIVSLHGEHDLSTCSELRSTLAPLDGNVLLDLSTCEFIDSSVIGVVAAKSRDLAGQGHRLELVVPAANRVVTRVVNVVGLRTLMTVHEQLASATGTDTSRAVDCA